MKYLLIIPIIAIPSLSLAWKAPVLESQCLDGKNLVTVTIGTEANYMVEFADNPAFTEKTVINFVHAGSHAQYIPFTGTIYARFASDHNAKTSIQSAECAPEKKKGKKVRKHKSGYIRRPSVFANPIPAILPLFDYPVPLPDVKG